MKIELAVRNQGHVPSFKNTKQIARNRKTKQPFIMTDPKKKKWMDRCIQSLESQLFCMWQTNADGMQTVLRQLFSTASSEPSMDFDDSIDWIPEIHILVRRVDKGAEGAVIILETL